MHVRFCTVLVALQGGPEGFRRGGGQGSGGGGQGSGGGWQGAGVGRKGASGGFFRRFGVGLEAG